MIEEKRTEQKREAYPSTAFGGPPPLSRGGIVDVPMRAQRSLETVTAEIRTLQDAARRVVLGYSIEIGRRLVEAKGMVEHGEWGTYLREELGFSQSTANNHMRLFEAYGAEQMSLTGAQVKSQAFADLSYTQALELLALPSEEAREAFVQEHDMASLSTRELREELRRRLREDGGGEEVRDTTSSAPLRGAPSPQGEGFTGDGEDGSFDSGFASAQDDEKDGGSAEQLAKGLRVSEQFRREMAEQMEQLRQQAQEAALAKDAAEAARAEAEERARKAEAAVAAQEREAAQVASNARRYEDAVSGKAEAERKLRAAETAAKKAQQEAREATKKAEADFVKKKEQMLREAREAAQAELKAKAEQEAAQAAGDAQRYQEELEALKKELAVAAPEVAVFRDHFQRLQEDFSSLWIDAICLPQEAREAAIKAVTAWLRQALQEREEIMEEWDNG